MSSDKRPCWRASTVCIVFLAWPAMQAAQRLPEDRGQAAATRAVQAEKRGQFALAIAEFRQAIELGLDNPEVRSDLGIAYFQTGQDSAALREFKRALAERPQFLPPTVFSGLALLKLKQPKQALPFLEKAHTAQPQALEVTLALARAELGSNQVSRANALYKQASTAHPKKPEVWLGLGITDRVLAEMEAKRAKHSGLLRPGSPADAKMKRLLAASESAMQKGLALDPGSVRAEMVFAESFRIAERFGDAIREYEAITQRQPDFAPAWAGLAATYSASGASGKALKAALRATALDPRDADSQMLLAGLYLREGAYAKAKPHVLSAIRSRPGLAAAHMALAKIDITEHRLSAAVPELEQAVKGNQEAYYLLAVTLRQLGRPKEANSALRKFRRFHDVHAGKQ